MKRILFLTVLLTACATPQARYYKCFNINNGKNPMLNVGDVFCIYDLDMKHMDNQGYDDSDIAKFMQYVTRSEDTKCDFAENDKSKGYFTYYSGNPVDYDANVYACPYGTVSIFEEFAKGEEEKVAAKEEKQEQAKMKKALAEYPKVRPQVRSVFKEACIATYEKDSVKAYATNVCECLTCVFDSMHGEAVAYSYIKSDGKSWDINAPAMIVMDGFGGRCADYYMNRTAFDPCKWAKDNEKAKK